MFQVREQWRIRHNTAIWLSKSFKNTNLCNSTGKMASCRISGNNYLFWIDTQLLKGLRNNPAVNLKAITKRNRKWIFWSQPIINRKYHYVIVPHHICPLPRVIRMLKAAHADEGTPMEMQYYFFYFMF